jgi:HlyD family secretion protein
MSPLRKEVVEESPPLPEDPFPVPAEKAEPPRSHRLLVIAAVLLLGAAGLFFVLRRKPAPGTGSSPPIAEPAAAWSGLRLKGTTEALHARSILVPELSGQQVGTLTITRLVSAGTRVKRGDLLVEFDRQGQIRDFLAKQAEYQKLADQVIQEQAKEDAARARDETELRQAGNDLKQAELEMQKVEILSRIDAEKAQETLEEAKATLRQLRDTFDLKRKAAQAGIRILQIQRDRNQQAMLHAQSNAELMQVHSPFDGVVVLNTIWKEGKMGEVQEGDQVRPGVPFMQVVDPSEMEVWVLANQADFLGLHVGQLADVRLDAYPEMVFPARLRQIAPIGRAGSFSQKVRNFAVVFSLQGHDPRLMPDLSAAVDLKADNAGSSGSP